MNAVQASAVGWIILVCAALTWEGLGLAGWHGMWPLTWLVRDAMAHHESAVLGVCLAVFGFPAWLAYHFLIERRTYGPHPHTKGVKP